MQQVNLLIALYKVIEHIDDDMQQIDINKLDDETADYVRDVQINLKALNKYADENNGALSDVVVEIDD